MTLRLATRRSREALYACGLDTISVSQVELTLGKFIVQSLYLHSETLRGKVTSCLYHDSALEGGNVVHLPLP